MFVQPTVRSGFLHRSPAIDQYLDISIDICDHRNQANLETREYVNWPKSCLEHDVDDQAFVGARLSKFSKLAMIGQDHDIRTILIFFDAWLLLPFEIYRKHIVLMLILLFTYTVINLGSEGSIGKATGP